MNLLAILKDRFRNALAPFQLSESRVGELLDMIRPAQDAKFGDYQANFAMPLGKQLSRPPREIAAEVAGRAELADICLPPEIAGPGFINLRFKEDWLASQLDHALPDERLGIAAADKPQTIVLDYSSPNVAKPMHVGHIRSTVIGDSLYRLLRFLGHQVISDNHIGDWGTQFGMILYGYKHFRDEAAYRANPVAELGRLYKLVNKLVDYRESLRALPEAKRRQGERQTALAALPSEPKTGDKLADKKKAQEQAKLQDQVKELREGLAGLEGKVAAIQGDAQLSRLANEHPQIDSAVLEETARLHAGDPENLRLWHEFLPSCRDEIARVYKRLGVRFDFEYGESFYHDRLAAVVSDLQAKGLAVESQGAVCVFLDGFDAPMIVQKKDGAFLYSTSDLATIQFRLETWRPSVILYVVDHRQSEHFEKLFAAARHWGVKNVGLEHIKFGTVMGTDGKPYKTREGVAAGLESLLDEAVSRAAAIVADNDSDKRLSAAHRQEVAEVVGIGALKYADLSQNRTSDYTFSYDKMLLMNGNTATYMQYSYARVRSIFAKGGVTAAQVRAGGNSITLGHVAERGLALQLLRFEEALLEAATERMPHYLTSYLFELAKSYSIFFEQCPVLRAETEAQRSSRLLLCDLTARTIRLGLDLLGIQVVEQM